jgi:hypothetical protein
MVAPCRRLRVFSSFDRAEDDRSIKLLAAKIQETARQETSMASPELKRVLSGVSAARRFACTPIARLLAASAQHSRSA